MTTHFTRYLQQQLCGTRPEFHNLYPETLAKAMELVKLMIHELTGLQIN